MDSKFFEVRDRATRIVVLAIHTNRSNTTDLIEKQAWNASGYETPTIMLIQLYNAKCEADPYNWPEGTMRWAHDYIERNWGKLNSGQVIDVRVFARNENTEPAAPEVFV